MSSVLRISTVMVVAFALVAGLRGPRVFASTRIATDAGTDREALVALYEATDGDNWINNDNWLTDAPIGTWYGVNTDDGGRVIELILSKNGLNGTIPPELNNLTDLEVLSLFENELSGTIPPELGSLANLKGLDLSENRLSGMIPSELSKLTNLRWLILTDNQFSGTIPSELGNLISLEGLFLWGNELSGEIPSELGNLTNLEWLHLLGNELSGEIPSELGNLTNLEGLVLGGNRLSGEIPSELGNLTSLEELYLSGNQLTGCVPASWRNVEGNDLDKLSLPFCAAPSPTATPTPERLTPVQLFQEVSPAIAFIQTEIGSGSGVLIEGGYVVTNAHVVWPFDAARVVFPDGTEFEQVPVKGWDLLTDLAVLGPIDVPAEPVTLRGGEDIPTASDMYLIGYPGEVEAYPQPAFVTGSLSRLREWEPVGITYFQVDALIIGGQSGGALVSAAGKVIGISGFKYKEEFALAASSADILPRIRQLIDGDDPAGLGERQLSLEGGVRRHELTLQSYGDAYILDAYILNEPVGTAIEVELSGANEGGFRIFDAMGLELTDDKADSFSFVTKRSGLHFLVVSKSGSGKFTLIANRPLARFDDPDDSQRIQVGQSLNGNIDFPGDIDLFHLRLEKDEMVEIVTRSVLTDTYLAILGASEEEWVADDNSGGGLVGLDSRIVYRAPRTGEYFLLVEDTSWSAPGGYVISVERAEETDRLTPLASSGFPTHSVPVVSIHNPLVIPIGDTPAVSWGSFQDWPAFEDEALGLKVFYPSGWIVPSSREELPSFRQQLGNLDIAAEALSSERTIHIDSLTSGEEKGQFVGGAFWFDPELPQEYANEISLFAIPTKGRTLEAFAQLLVDNLEETGGPTLESVEVGPGLRLGDEEAASIRFGTGGIMVWVDRVVVMASTEAVGWQVVLHSPDRETFLVITFDVWGEEFDRVEPLLREIVRRVQWLDHPAYEPPTGPTVTINGTMNVRGGPGTNYPVVGAATAGQQFAALSRNAAGDWWQIEFEGRLAWVYGGLVTASADAASAPQADRSGWLTHEDEARGLSLSLPPEWRYFDPARPSQADLALFSAARRGDEEQLDIAEMGAMVSAMSAGSEDAVVGLGIQADQANDASSNFMLVFSFAADGLSLERYVQVVADRLQDSYGVEADSVELVPELRPLGEEAVSIRYRESETNSEVWQVWLLSPDEKALLALAFSVHSDEFAELEPLVREIVQKAQWSNQPAPSFPVVTVNGNMNVRGGPGTFYPVLGTASAGEQFAITGKNSSGAWWRISYNEQPGWVFSQLVTASGPLEDVPLVKAYDWDAFHDGERRLWIFYPPGWFFFDPTQPSEADRKSLGDLIGQENAEQLLRDFAADMDTGQRERYVGFGFKVAPDSTAQIEVSAFPSEGLTLGQVMSIVQEGLRESGLDVDSAEMVTNLRHDGAGTVSIRYRDNRAGLGSERMYWQVWTVSPDQGTFLRISFIFQSSESAQLVPLLSEMVRRIRWE